MQILQDQNFIKKLCSMWDFYIIEGGRIERLAGNWPGCILLVAYAEDLQAMSLANYNTIYS